MVFKLLFFAVSLCEIAYLQAKPKSENDNPSASLIFAGDISFDGPVKYFAEQEKTCNYSAAFSKVRELLKKADLRIGNLESPLLTSPSSNEKAMVGKGVHHFGLTKAVLGLKSAGFDVMQLANNHLVDYGTKGVQSTIDALKSAGIDYVGVRSRSNRRQKPLIKTVNGIKIGFLSYCLNKEGCEVFEDKDRNFSNIFEFAPSVFHKALARKDIKDLKKQSDIVVVLMHWSRELSLIPPLGIRDIARAMSIYGANLIIGTHPHVIQGHECTGGNTFTAYSLGNFLFGRNGVKVFSRFLGGRIPTKEHVKSYVKEMKEVYSPTQLGYMMRIIVTKKGLKSGGYIPVEIKNEPRTNCLQPTPVTQKWQALCKLEDLYCTEFRDVYASGNSGLKEQLDTIVSKSNYCFNERL